MLISGARELEWINSDAYINALIALSKHEGKADHGE